jgi:hypothetical protein
MQELTITDAEKAHEYLNRIKLIQQRTVQGYVEMGAYLSWLISSNHWKLCGSHIKTKNDFWKEIKVKKSTAHLAMDIYELFFETFEKNSELLAIDVQTVAKLIPYARQMNEEEKEEILTQAVHLTEKGLNDNLAEKSGLTATDTCEHEESTIISICKKCGFRSKLS